MIETLLKEGNDYTILSLLPSYEAVLISEFFVKIQLQNVNICQMLGMLQLH